MKSSKHEDFETEKIKFQAAVKYLDQLLICYSSHGNRTFVELFDVKTEMFFHCIV